jgi:glucose-6-phosphate isomerase
MDQQRQALFDYARENKSRRLLDLFSNHASRVDLFSFQAGPIYFDFSKQPIDDEAVRLFEDLAESCRLDEHRDELFSGAIVNPSENRPALHTALRAMKPPQQSALGDKVASRVAAERQACMTFAEKVRSGELKPASGKPYKYLIHIGIGGSYLGPKLLIDTLKGGADQPLETHLLANIDGHALTPILEQCEPKETLVIVVSKTFTTQETLTNTRSVLSWMQDQGVANPLDQFVAITSSPDNASEFGIKDSQTFTFAEWVGGRYSIWSSVSLAAMIALGPGNFQRFLDGAATMDDHFCSSPLACNAPMLAALLDFYFATILGAESRAVFPYDARLQDLVPYLQQLEMESNGKTTTATGEPIGFPTCPVVWGGVGTDAQHAVFQLLHQGSHLVPTEFIAVKQANHDFTGHHQALLANCFAQSAALMSGRGDDFPGNKPSTTLLLDQLTPESLGAMLAFYEHRTFIASLLWQLNAFDQPGVQLGKDIAKQLEQMLAGKPTELDLDPSTKNLLSKLGEKKK